MGPCLWMTVALAQDVPVPNGKVEPPPRRTFDSREYEALEEFRALYDERTELKDAEIEALRQQLERRAIEQGLVTPEQLAAANATSKSQAAVEGSRPAASSGGSTVAAPPSTVPLSGPRSQGSPPSTLPPIQTSLGSTLVFAVPDRPESARETVVPAGSYVKVRILTGVEATVRDDLPMLVQADHALVGPNRRRIDLRGCMILLQVKGELSTDRVVGKAVRLSCVRDDGEHVSREINGYLAGEDSTFGVVGQLITRQGRVVAAATVASLAQAAGEAVATAQESRQLIANPLGGAATEITNIDGNGAAYVAGTAGAAGAGLVANWYLKYADQLLPAIAVGSGRDVWVVLIDSVTVPPLAVGAP